MAESTDKNRTDYGSIFRCDTNRYSHLGDGDGDGDAVTDSRAEHLGFKTRRASFVVFFVVCCIILIFSLDDTQEVTPNAVHRGYPTNSENPLEHLAPLLEQFKEPVVRRSVNGELNTTIRVQSAQYVNGPISFWTRTYEGIIPGPTLSIRPGDHVNIQLVNELEENVKGNWTPNTLHNPNTTNLHVHGMHVDPTGTSDNIFRTVEPGQTSISQYKIPSNHPHGVFHYHPHHHGSVFLQMGGGMVGAIIVEDDEAIVPDEYAGLTKQLLVLQEFKFSGGFASGLLQGAQASRSKLQMNPVYTEKSKLDAKVRAYFPELHPADKPVKSIGLADELAMDEKPLLGGFFTVNGQYLPKISLKAGENRVLRLLNAGGTNALELSVPGCDMSLVASDGIYLKQGPRKIANEALLLSPGARADVILNCQSIKKSDLLPFVSQKHESFDNFLGEGADVFEGIVAFIELEVTKETQDAMVMPITRIPSSSDLYKEDLRQIKPSREPFIFEFSMGGKSLRDGFQYKNYFINGALFNMSKAIREIPLNDVEEWFIINREDFNGKVARKNHPFHIHTNSFQVVDMSHGEGVDYKIGDWRDVIAVPTPGNVTIRFRPVDFKGLIVAHCHIIGHSDAGMIAAVEIV
jgi:FtsP/CotA-like multicopper oxidase with cupredoxin domain